MCSSRSFRIAIHRKIAFGFSPAVALVSIRSGCVGAEKKFEWIATQHPTGDIDLLRDVIKISQRFPAPNGKLHSFNVFPMWWRKLGSRTGKEEAGRERNKGVVGEGEVRWGENLKFKKKITMKSRNFKIFYNFFFLEFKV